MTADEDFWDDLLGHLSEGMLVPVVGPELSVVTDGDREVTLSRLLGERLAARYKVDVQWGDPGGLDDAVRAVLASAGRDKLERLYRVINDALRELNPAPPAALRQLASIGDLHLFISTTFDSLLARAIDLERFAGAQATQEFWFAPNQSTDAQQSNARTPSQDAVVFKLFGEASSVPQYAIHEEDTLEWLHALLSETAHLPEWVQHQLKERPLLLIGCQLPDWIGRFLVRMASTNRLSLGSKQFFIVGNRLTESTTLTTFFHTYCSPTCIQVLDQDPRAFVTELVQRWQARRGVTRNAPATATSDTASATGSIFISYVREDIDSARRLASAIAGIGGDVWLDERRLQPGDRWEQEILSSVRRGVRLFLPLISRQTEAREEGYVFKEWSEAAERAKGIPNRRFIVPIVVDSDYAGNPATYHTVPEAFRALHFGHAPGGQPTAPLLDALSQEIRNMRRPADSR